MANGWYKKQRRYLAQQGKENFVEIRGQPHTNYGHMPHAYHTGRNTFWIPKHYAPLTAHLQRWHGGLFLDRALNAIPREWWLVLDPYKEHIMVLAQIPDYGMTLREWVYEVNPHTVFAPMPNESHIYEP